MKVICPHCKELMEVTDERRGRPVRCESCGQGFRAPLAEMQEGRAPTSFGVADQLMIIGAALCGLGLVLTVAAIVAARAGQGFSVPRGLPVYLLIVPFGSIAASWWGARKSCRRWLVALSRVLAYAWIAGMILLLRVS